MPLTLTPDELVSFKIMCAFIKATKSVEHEIVTTFCKRKGISVDELVDAPMKGGTIREMILKHSREISGIDDETEGVQIARLKRTGLVDISTEPTYPIGT